MCRVGTKIFRAYNTDFALTEELKLSSLLSHYVDIFGSAQVYVQYVVRFERR